MTNDEFYGRNYPEPDDPGPEDNPTIPALRDDELVVRSRMLDGEAFILGSPDHVPAIWGRGESVLWAEGESLVLAGAPGVGKTTLAGQLVRARLIGGDVLGLPVEPARRRVLYLAMDRPLQIRRALRRVLGDLPAELLREQFRGWPGPPITDIAKHPETLLGYAEIADADTLFLDSMKDAAIGLTEDDVAAGYNRARQMCIAAGVELVELHHLVKRGANGAKPTTLSDLYGSVWLTAGAGSVVLLHGVAGDPIVELHHLKQPASEVGPWHVIHDHDAGTSSVWHQTDLLVMARARGDQGLTAKAAAAALFSVVKPTAAQTEKARRRLDSLVRSGQLAFAEGDKTIPRPAVWTITETFTGTSSTVTHHDPSEASRLTLTETITETITGITLPDHHDRDPLYIEGRDGGPSDCTDCGATLGRDELPNGVCRRCERIRRAGEAAT